MVVAVRLLIKLIYLGVCLWLIATAGLFVAMQFPPEQFAAVAAKVPNRIVMGALPFRPLWTWSRRGALQVGDQAPDFDLERHDRKGRVRLTSFLRKKPVVLVFGSYT